MLDLELVINYKWLVHLNHGGVVGAKVERFAKALRFTDSILVFRDWLFVNMTLNVIKIYS